MRQRLLRRGNPGARRGIGMAFTDAPGGRTGVVVRFDAEPEHGTDLQPHGWQAILDNFARHAEAKSVA